MTPCRAEIVFGCNGGRPGLRPCFRAAASPFFFALGNQSALELRNGPKDVEHQLARSGGSIDPLLQADQIDLSGFYVCDRTRGISPFPAPTPRPDLSNPITVDNSVDNSVDKYQKIQGQRSCKYRGRSRASILSPYQFLSTPSKYRGSGRTSSFDAYENSKNTGVAVALRSFQHPKPLPERPIYAKYRGGSRANTGVGVAQIQGWESRSKTFFILCSVTYSTINPLFKPVINPLVLLLCRQTL